MKVKSMNMPSYYTQFVFDDHSMCHIQHSSSNCKLTYLDYIGSLHYNDFVEKLKKVLENCKIVVSLNTSQEDTANDILENFEIYSYNKIPVGYHGGYQHHITIRNTYATGGLKNTDNMRESEYREPLDKNVVKHKFIEVLKQHNRKTDIAEKLIEQL